MKVEISLPEEAVAAIVAKMREEGLCVPAEGRTTPFSVEELVVETGVSETGVRRLVEAGTLKRIPGVGRVLVPVESLREWQRGGSK